MAEEGADTAVKDGFFSTDSAADYVHFAEELDVGDSCSFLEGSRITKDCNRNIFYCQLPTGQCARKNGVQTGTCRFKNANRIYKGTVAAVCGCNGIYYKKPEFAKNAGQNVRCNTGIIRDGDRCSCGNGEKEDSDFSEDIGNDTVDHSNFYEDKDSSDNKDKGKEERVEAEEVDNNFYEDNEFKVLAEK